MFNRELLTPKSTSRKLTSVAMESGTLAIGEGTARVCTMLTLVLVSRKFGVSTLGSLALAQTLGIYIALGIDAGSRHIGAKLIAAHPESLRTTQRQIQRKRLMLALLAIPFGFLYARLGPIPGNAKTLVSLYILFIAPYCLSLDWVLWGAKRYGSLSASRALVSALPLAALGVALLFGVDPGWAIPVSAGFGYAGSSAYTRWRCNRLFHSEAAAVTERFCEIGTQTDWGSILVLGAALACNQAFNNIDSLMLGGLTNLQQVGLYSSAYRLLSALLGVYYLLTTTMYPRIAAVSPEKRNASRLKPYLLAAFLAGVLPAMVVHHFSRWIIVAVYGQNFAKGAPMLSLLIMALPLDFVTSFCGITMVAWGMSKRVLLATGTGAAVNISANLYLIPRYGGIGASWATLISYFVLLAILLFMLLGRSPAAKFASEDASMRERTVECA
jgi:O-antigen/teichoic acid export membrane protein